ncbi:Glutathione S-transferase U16 [Apostasia shenzhenica]|uniref:glutathione transferase n=1 Tax=Apostasia shenzhenica TaxID=1088818 RepID=A0A2I0AY45_9ASPA|nr:Glutathione S-transferase U16 [Apostasia shenzhenica]
MKGVECQNLEEQDIFNKLVPVLIHHGVPICESMIIVQYIDEVWSSGEPHILPADPLERAAARFWAFYLDDKMFSSLNDQLFAVTEETKLKAAEEASEAIEPLEADLRRSGKPLFGGDVLGFVDIVLGVFLPSIRALERMDGIQILNEAKLPNLARWEERFCSDDAVKEAFPAVEEVIAAFEHIRRQSSIE